jgi:hypothetical protein
MKALDGIAFVFVSAMAFGVIPAAPIAYASAIAVLGFVISR